MMDHVKLSPDVTIVANEGTVFVSWLDGATSTEDEQEVGPLLLSCRRARSYDELTEVYDQGLVDRLLRQGLLVPWVNGAALRLHHATLGGDLVPRGGPPLQGQAVDDLRLLREYGTSRTLDLPEPRSVPQSLDEVLAHRFSTRTFTGRPLNLVGLSTLVATALGTGHASSVRPRVIGGPPARTAYPSPGALYPVELALFAWRVLDLDRGVYRYQATGHRLARTGEVTDADATALAGDAAEGAAALLVLWCDLFSPTLSKYGGKGYRLVLLEAGHIMQNLVLVSTALGLPALPVAGIRDDDVARTLRLMSPEQVPIYALLVGGAA
jgi:SagB-type dehydrogenase family enzyme